MSVFITEAFGLTDIGKIRSSNQDAFYSEPKEGLFIVADGMGGHAGGQVASQVCVEEIKKAVLQSSSIKTFQSLSKEGSLISKKTKDASFTVRSELADAVNKASLKIYERSLEDQALRGMGTTASLLFICGRHGFWAHVGDSRIYLMRSGFLYQLTLDHSLVEEQKRQGLITEEEAAVHQLKNVITRSVGYQEEEEVDTGYLHVEPSDIFLLCSDGLHSKINDDEWLNLISKQDLTAASKQLMELALERGGEDNISLILLKLV